MNANELVQSAYQHAADNPKPTTTGFVLLGIALYLATNALWPVVLAALVGGLFVAYGAGLEELESREWDYE